MKADWQKQAEALWGERWKSILARTAGISKRTIQRWIADQNSPYPDILEKLDRTYNIWKSADR